MLHAMHALPCYMTLHRQAIFAPSPLGPLGPYRAHVDPWGPMWAHVHWPYVGPWAPVWTLCGLLCTRAVLFRFELSSGGAAWVLLKSSGHTHSVREPIIPHK